MPQLIVRPVYSYEISHSKMPKMRGQRVRVHSNQTDRLSRRGRRGMLFELRRGGRHTGVGFHCIQGARLGKEARIYFQAQTKGRVSRVAEPGRSATTEHLPTDAVKSTV